MVAPETAAHAAGTSALLPMLTLGIPGSPTAAVTSTANAQLHLAGSGAQITANVSGGSVASLSVTNSGSGYTVAPVLSFSGPQTGSARAGATATMGTSPWTGKVTGTSGLVGGSGYTSATVTVENPVTTGIGPTSTRIPVNSVAGFPSPTGGQSQEIVMTNGTQVR